MQLTLAEKDNSFKTFQIFLVLHFPALNSGFRAVNIPPHLRSRYLVRAFRVAV